MKCECGNETFFSSNINNVDYWVCRECNKRKLKEQIEQKKDYFNKKEIKEK